MTEPVAQTHTHENAPGVGRLIALSDGIYAIAMTLLVIDVAVPAHLNDAAFHQALSDALPSLGAFALSFTLLAGFWRDQRRILASLPVESFVITQLILLGLGLVALLPFPTGLLAEYASQPEAVALYAGAMAAIHAVHTTLLLLTQRQVHPSPASPEAVARRRFTAQLASSVLIFCLSIPLAFVNTEAAMWFWLALVPAHVVLRRFPRRLAPTP
ncbi:TMEM175 family protein [Streptomyces pseudovenezuelae]|uniref:Membrane protein n=1 Tax=Streptomyces pseudovenezuelae TaxID=67350 RepID=A0ABT6LGE1_9ACTN|nr:TMEM175 family protein [Streptomyces pseudovenezuelae]MDH6215371.1 putative membrane protein [Streptomyces pseudovenezuelae]